MQWRRKLGRVLGSEKVVFLNQVHGENVLVLNGKGTWGPGMPGARADAVITRQRDRLLVIQVADCQAIMMVDPREKVVANVHAGWRGSVADIAGKTVVAMERYFGSRSSDLVCAIGPSLGPCCAEFVNFARELPETFTGYKDGNRRFDFWQITADQLKSVGVRPENILQSRICTRCNPALFYSYRGQKTPLRFAAAIGLL